MHHAPGAELFSAILKFVFISFSPVFTTSPPGTPGRQWCDVRNEVETLIYRAATQNSYFLKRHSQICRKGLMKKFRKEKQTV